ncbi:hypothetical protein CEXT_151031 [Caerostris extrusa]|uniref:Uncharacterized protein n=1 Tax=Caerostris extrusa TaxID=172846 RepID=A0AAV4V0T2_CAEEX|nr:hypothetical protein CEXT_151031 [Caerostris extrusa]
MRYGRLKELCNPISCAVRDIWSLKVALVNGCLIRVTPTSRVMEKGGKVKYKYGWIGCYSVCPIDQSLKGVRFLTALTGYVTANINGFLV